MNVVRWGNHTRSDDEWYTSPKLAKEFIDFHWKYIKNFKKIICPCDTEESYIYRELVARGCDVDCCVDMWNCNYSNYDLVVTNPPFSMAGKWMKWLNDVVKIKFISFCSWSTAVKMIMRGKYINEMYITMSRFNAKTRTKEHFYNRPESCSWTILSNIEACRECVLKSAISTWKSWNFMCNRWWIYWRKAIWGNCRDREGIHLWFGGLWKICSVGTVLT